MTSRNSSTLRSINNRLKAVSLSHLPSIIPQISRSLLDCKNLLSTPPSTSKDSADGVALHTFKTHITTLLSGKTPETRWAAIVLIKTTIELGGLEILQTCKPWVNGLLSILAKPDSPTTKKLCILTLTRIFMLTHGHQTIIREITTPSLPAFVTACLNLVAPKNASKTMSVKMQTRVQAVLLQPVLECFGQLLPRHPTIFRTFISQLQAVLAALLAPTPSDSTRTSETAYSLATDPAIVTAARKLYTLLHYSIAKSNNNSNNNNSSSSTTASDTDYTKSLLALLQITHATADATFRSIIEDWTSLSGVTSTISPSSYSSEISSSHIDLTTAHANIGSSLSLLASWTGIHAGCERLTGLLDLLRTYLSTSHTALPVTIPISAIIDLLIRITSVTVPPPKSATSSNSLLDTSIRSNEQISHTERESFFTQLPDIHISALRVMNALLARFGTASTPYAQVLLQQTTWIFAAEANNVRVRRQCYRVCTTFVALFGRSFDKETSKSLFRMMKRASGDVLSSVDPADESTIATKSTPASTSTSNSSNKKPAPAQTTTLNESSLLTSATTSASSLFTSSHQSSSTPTPLQLSALDFITTCLLKIPSPHISPSIRAQLDRAAVLSNNREAMLASVLNPPVNKSLAKSHSSILPFLARGYGDVVEVEGLVRPRMPILGVTYGGDVDENDQEEEDEGEFDMDDAQDEDQQENLGSSNDEDGIEVDSKQRGIGASAEKEKAKPAFPRRSGPPAAPTIASTAPSSSLPQKRPPPAQPLASPATKKTRQEASQSGPSTDIVSMASINSNVQLVNSDEQRSVDDVGVVSNVPSQPVTTTTTDGQVMTTAVTNLAATSDALVDDDDDDFEIPELNMDPDTEEEEEGDEVDD